MVKTQYNDHLEKILTAIFGSVGLVVIIIQLFINGFTINNLLDAAKDIAGLIVVIAVFLVANRIFSLTRLKKFDFKNAFENYLKEWVSRNEYLVCETFDDNGKGKSNKRHCSMMIDHSNLITRKKLAKDATKNIEKGAFVYLPYYDENNTLRNEFEFRFNQRTFDRQKIFRTSDGGVDLKTIIEEFRKRIEDSFPDQGISVKANPSQSTLTVSFKGMEQNDKNARALVDIVEFVKTLVLALS